MTASVYRNLNKMRIAKAVEVPRRAASLNSNDVFFLKTSSGSFIWCGKWATGDERELAKKTGRNANNMKKIQAAKVVLKLKSDFNASSIEFVDDGKELKLHPAEKKVFNDLNIREQSVKSAEEAGADEVVEEGLKSFLTLYHCSDEEGDYKITEIRNGPLNQSDLKSNDCFIIDNGNNGIWVWIGKKASTKVRIEALANAHGFVTKKGYPSSTTVTRVVDGGEHVEFKMLFSSWKGKNQTTGLGKQNTVNHIAVTVHTKLDASTIYEKPQLAAKSQLVDDGFGTNVVLLRRKNS